ncbi:MAG TPA: aminotransferase class IV, partial [Dehalococcoidia bacterium]|nr:aminotransferase class IV [Dehalococcoidia bacterium]
MEFRPSRTVGSLVGGALAAWCAVLAAALVVRGLMLDVELSVIPLYVAATVFALLALLFAYWTYSLGTLRYTIDRNALTITWGDIRQMVPLSQIERLKKSAHIMHIGLPQSAQELSDICASVVERCGFREDVYIRPIAYKSGQVIGPKLDGVEDDFLCFVIPFGNYLEVDAGIRCQTSTWRRVPDTSIPARAKVNGLYVNSALAKTEAVENGFDEAIMLNDDGHVSEGSGENLAMVRHGRLITPERSDNVLEGITLDSVCQLARDELGMEVIERTIDRSELYIADEVFLTGTAAHISPVIEVDRRAV